MPLRTREEYLAKLKAMRPNIHKFGERIEDVTTHPATRRAVEAHCRGLDAAHNPELADLFTTTSSLTGETILRHTSLMTTPEEMIYNSKLKREMYHQSGTCVGGLCVGWNAINVLWSVTHEVDEAMGTDYHERLKAHVLEMQAQGTMGAGALTDAKGNRKLKPHQQADPDSNLHIVERRDDGIVIRGAKVMICGTASSDEIFLMPGSAYGEPDADYALACVVPRDVEGLTIVEARRPSDTRDLEEGFDNPNEAGVTQAYLFFEDVFVPTKHVFLAGEYKFTLPLITRFTSTYRSCIGACVAGQGDMMVGASALIARANGLSAKVFKDKLIQMETNNETTYAMGIGAIALGTKHPSGVWLADTLTGHTNKIHVATLPYETKRLAQEIGGGIAETGCIPSYKDIENPEYGPLIKRFLKAGECSGESRARIARLIEWLTLGGGVPGCMHGGGSPDGARMVVFGLTPLEKYAATAKKLAGVDEEVTEPAKK